MDIKEPCVCVSLDKDLLQFEGWHYNFVKSEWKFIDTHTGWVNFYTQLIMGDKSDNIKGFDGLMRQLPPKFLQPTLDAIREARTPQGMFEVVQSVYELGDDALHRNAQLLYIQRYEGDKFCVPAD